MTKKMYEIRYGVYESYKTVKISDWERARAFYDKVKRFAESHNLVWIVALWNDGWLIKSETVNGEIVQF